MLSTGFETADELRKANNRTSRMLRLDWLGQTIASLCWIGSVLAYGISSVGDVLQLAAASAWLVANLATLYQVDAER